MRRIQSTTLPPQSTVFTRDSSASTFAFSMCAASRCIYVYRAELTALHRCAQNSCRLKKNWYSATRISAAGRCWKVTEVQYFFAIRNRAIKPLRSWKVIPKDTAVVSRLRTRIWGLGPHRLGRAGQ
jgi:hypothetical protein